MEICFVNLSNIHISNIHKNIHQAIVSKYQCMHIAQYFIMHKVQTFLLFTLMVCKHRT